MADEVITQLVARLEKVTARLESLEKQVAQGPSSSPTAPSSSSVAEYEELISQDIQPFITLSTKIGDKNVIDQANLVLQVVEQQREFLKVVASSKKPSDEVFQTLLKPTSDLMEKIRSITESNRPSKFANNLFTISEGIGALGWICVSPTPAPYIGEMKGGSEFYSNKILKEFKGKDQTQVDWVLAYNSFLKDLQAFVKKNHTTGLSWNPQGGNVSSVPPTTGSTPTSGGSPPPPPGPVPDISLLMAQTSTPTPQKSVDMGALFSSLNKGEDVSSGLKKVTNDMKTKNRTDKVNVVPGETVKKSSTPGKTARGPAKFALEGNKWVVENQVGNQSIVIDRTEPKHVIYIFGCINSVIQIKGKVNAISVDDCEKTGVVFENAISSIEVVNSRSVQVEVQGRVPSVAIDKTSGIQLFSFSHYT